MVRSYRHIVSSRFSRRSVVGQRRMMVVLLVAVTHDEGDNAGADSSSAVTMIMLDPRLLLDVWGSSLSPFLILRLQNLLRGAAFLLLFRISLATNANFVGCGSG
jgi:hypothetical protein